MFVITCFIATSTMSVSVMEKRLVMCLQSAKGFIRWWLAMFPLWVSRLFQIIIHAWTLLASETSAKNQKVSIKWGVQQQQELEIY